jgi:D-alanyl-D-alanine dipeptidase
MTDIREYLAEIRENPGMEMVDLEKSASGIRLDIRYATPDNFTGQVIYTAPRAFVRLPVARALQKVQDSLKFHHLSLKIFDAYRPYAATLKFYEVYPDTSFVANPRFGSRHNRGCAVDVTLVESGTGRELPMPTKFDDFTEKAGYSFQDLPADALANRALLAGIMSHFGFIPYPSEWWHFDFKGWERFGLMDLSFEELDSIID